MPQVSLADIQKAAEQKYGDYTIDLGGGRLLTLRNALRLPKDQRDRLAQLQRQITTAQDGDQDLDALIDTVRDAVRLLVDSPELAEELLDAVGDDLPVLLEVFAGYQESAQPGEASPSPS